MTVDASGQLLVRLEQSRLVSAEDLAICQSLVAEGNPPETAFRRLIDRGVLTPWQAEMLFQGQSSFFLGNYKLLSLLGQGGMGAVFKAEQVSLRRIVALKLMAPELMKNPQSVARFHREIQAAAALSHPHVVAAIDADQVNKTHFLVMEYLEGEGLDEILRREGRIHFTLACEYIRQAALGLQHAHERGMAHRDIKPSNLLLTRTADGEPLVKVLDMGLARFTSESRDEGELTRTGQVMGTPDYIAPEQARQSKAADIRSDIFSLGCTLFRMLAGQVPFEGETVMEKLMARAMTDAPSVRQFRPEIRADLDAVLAKMMARNPADRYQTPAEVAKVLEPFTPNRIETAPTIDVVPATSPDVAPALREARIPANLNEFLQDLSNNAADPKTSETVTLSAGEAKRLPE